MGFRGLGFKPIFRSQSHPGLAVTGGARDGGHTMKLRIRRACRAFLLERRVEKWRWIKLWVSRLWFAFFSGIGGPGVPLVWVRRGSCGTMVQEVNRPVSFR